jgi:hypothetical protein
LSYIEKEVKKMSSRKDQRAVWVEKDVHELIKKYATERGSSVTFIISKILKMFFKNKKKGV